MAVNFVKYHLTKFKCLTLTAMPLRSDEAEAAVGDVFATVFVLVSEMWILDTGMPKHRAATWKKDKKKKKKQISWYTYTLLLLCHIQRLKSLGTVRVKRHGQNTQLFMAGYSNF